MDPLSATLQTVAIALAAGVACQFLAERLAIPSIAPLLVAGTLLGPDVFGWVRPEDLGGGLEALVSLSVAVILFEGGLHLEWNELKSQRAIILRLVGLGSLVTLALAALAAWLLLPVSGGVALVLGSLVIVTGPTVIGPLLKRVRVVRRVGFVLESEGVLNDPVGAILAFAVLGLFLGGELSFARGPASVLLRFAIGGAVGTFAGALLGTFLRRRWTSETEIANLVALATVIGAFVLSNRLQSESGLVAVVACGMVVGNLSIPGRRELVEFKGILTRLVISLLFILLSANIRWGILVDAGWGGVAWVAALLFVVRPLAVLVSAFGTDTPRADRLFLAWVAPRGIVAASVASLFAIELSHAAVEQAGLVQALVFLTIATTVIVHGSTAGLWARFLGVSAEAHGVAIVGASRFGRLLARLLCEAGREVTLIDSNPIHCVRARRDGFTAFPGNCLDVENLERIGLRAADALVAVTPNADVNYMVGRLALEEFRVPRALALANESDKRVDPATRERHRIERAFAVDVADGIEGEIGSDPEIWTARVEAGAPSTLGDLALEQGLALLRIHAGRAEVAADGTSLVAGDEILSLGEPRSAFLGNVARYRPPPVDEDGAVRR